MSLRGTWPLSFYLLHSFYTFISPLLNLSYQYLNTSQFFHFTIKICGFLSVVIIMFALHNKDLSWLCLPLVKLSSANV
jgi:hypothetical protein